MGQKVNPISFRLGMSEDWRSTWYARKSDFGKYLVEDQKVRRLIKKQYFFAGIPKIEIERANDAMRITVHTARPGLIIGRKGAEVERLKADVESVTSGPVEVVIKEVTKPELEAQLVAESVAQQLERRSAFRKTLRRASELTMENGAKGVKIMVSGRLSGAEMARCEHLLLGSIPLHTIRADISYGLAVAKTTYGTIGCKVWIYRGDAKPRDKELSAEEQAAQQEETADGNDA